MSDRALFKQLLGHFTSVMGVSGFSAEGFDDEVTSEITSAASSDNVPVQVATVTLNPTTTTEGFITSGPNNFVLLFEGNSRNAIEDGLGNEVFGRLTESSGIFKISYFSIQSGTETAVDLPSKTIDFFVNYNFLFKNLPNDFPIRVKVKQVGEDPSTQIGRPIDDELITITALNTLSDLAKNPTPNTKLWLSVNNIPAHEGAANSFTRSGKALTWDPVDAEYDLETTDKVIAHYYTLEA